MPLPWCPLHQVTTHTLKSDKGLRPSMLEAMTRLQRCVRVNNPEPGQNCKRAQQMFSGMYNDEDMLPSFQP